MHIVTKSEYDEAVQDVADRLFDPMLDSAFDVDDVVEAFETDETKQFADDVKSQLLAILQLEKVSDWGYFNKLPVSAYGNIVEHAESDYVRSSWKEVDKPPSDSFPRSMVKWAAKAAFARDVLDEVFERMKDEWDRHENDSVAEAA